MGALGFRWVGAKAAAQRHTVQGNPTAEKDPAQTSTGLRLRKPALELQSQEQVLWQQAEYRPRGRKDLGTFDLQRNGQRAGRLVVKGD